MKSMPTVRWLLGILVNPGWAPLAVAILHVALAERGLTDRFDHPLHFLGGAAIAYFLHGLIVRLQPTLGISCYGVRHLLAFTSACAVAVFWEFAEFASDRLRHTTIQRSVNETMLDLVFGVSGAFVSLSLILIAGRLFEVRQNWKQTIKKPPEGG